MNHVVKMERLPEGLRFPDDLHEKVEFDAAKKRLIWHGFMSKREFDRLFALSEDWSYRRQVEELFRLSVEAPASASSAKRPSPPAPPTAPTASKRGFSFGFGFGLFRSRS